jgi:hypothetical protein
MAAVVFGRVSEKKRGRMVEEEWFERGVHTAG